MTQINQLLASQTSKEAMHERQRKDSTRKLWSIEIERLTLELFARFASLYGNKCKSHGLLIHDEKGEYSETFKLWCLKLDRAGVDIKGFARAVENIEKEIADTVASKKEAWPPSYAEFIGYSRDSKHPSLKDWGGLSLPKSILSKEENHNKMAKLRESMKL